MLTIIHCPEHLHGRGQVDYIEQLETASALFLNLENPVQDSKTNASWMERRERLIQAERARKLCNCRTLWIFLDVWIQLHFRQLHAVGADRTRKFLKRDSKI
jgi:hypothetical protein